MRYVTTVEELLHLIDDGATGLIRQEPSRTRVVESASVIASVSNLESDAILSALISLGHEPTVSNADAQEIDELALHRAIAMRYLGAETSTVGVLAA